jgi:hypothetical protein
MSDLQELDNDINQMMLALKTKVDEVTAAPTLEEKRRLETDNRADLRRLKSALANFSKQIRVCNVPTQKAVFQKNYNEYEVRRKEYEKLLREQIYPKARTASQPGPVKSMTEIQHEELMGEGGEDGSGFKSATQVLGAAIRVNEDALKSISNSERILHTAEETGQNTMQELQKQTEKMYEIDKGLENLQGVIDHASRDVKWFARQLAKDKCFLSIFGIVLLLLVILVFFSIYKKNHP